MLSNISRR